MTYTIVSATKLSSVNLSRATALAKQHFGATATPTLKVDPSLLAGVKIIFGSSLLDLSLSSKIDRLVESIS